MHDSGIVTLLLKAVPRLCCCEPVTILQWQLNNTMRPVAEAHIAETLHAMQYHDMQLASCSAIT